MSNKQFNYWGKAWMKWAVLAGGLLTLFSLYEKIRDYQIVVESEIYSNEMLIRYMAQQKFSCLTTLICTLVFFGVFLIGSFARSRRSAKRAEALLLMSMAVIIAAGIVIWGPFLTTVMLVEWIVIAILSMGIGLYSFMKHGKQ